MKTFLWKPHIITLTEHPLARARKCDASFFPPVSEDTLTSWESENELLLPKDIRSFLEQSDGLEAQRGEIWPVLPLTQWDVIEDECFSPHPWIRFGETEEHLYFLSMGQSPSIYRQPRFGSEEEFFANNFDQFLQKIFRGEG